MRMTDGLGALLLVFAASCAEPTAPTAEPVGRPLVVESASQPPATTEPPPSTPPAQVAAEPVAPPPAATPAPQPPSPVATNSPPAATATPPATAAPPAAMASPAKPCPTGQCFWQGRCVKPGGPVGRPGDPPDVISGLCGGDGGPCHPCRCASPDTPIDTPHGPVPIKALHVGDEVYSIHQGKRAVVPVIAVQQMPVRDHAVVRVGLTGGAILELSGYHPLGDGRTLFDLAPGQALGGSLVEALVLVPYEQPFTYDILPDSDSGTYFARGVWLGSTMFGIPR